MFKNRFMNFGYLSLISVIFGIVISASFVKAEYPSDSYNDSTSAQQELDEGNTGEEELEEYEFYIKGMTCANCEVKVKDALLACAGVKKASVNHEDGYAVIEANAEMIDADEIIGAVGKAGFAVIEEE